MPTNAPRPSFLLVHGAWHRSGCWSLVREALAADGWTARTVDLPSAGPQRTPAAGMYDDADAIAAHLRRTEGRVIVVGHSYGGLPVTQAAAGEPATGHPAAAHLVYLAAYLRRRGLLLSVHGRGSTAPEDEDLSGTAPVVFDDPRTSLFGDLPDDRAEDAVGRIGRAKPTVVPAGGDPGGMANGALHLRALRARQGTPARVAGADVRPCRTRRATGHRPLTIPVRACRTGGSPRRDRLRRGPRLRCGLRLGRGLSVRSRSAMGAVVPGCLGGDHGAPPPPFRLSPDSALIR